MAHYLYLTAAPASSVPSRRPTRCGEMKLELAELSAIKTNLDTASRSATSQFAKLSDRLDQARSALASTETTGSIASAGMPAQHRLQRRNSPTGSCRIGWCRTSSVGRALVQSRNGGMFDVGEGSTLPGVGRIDEIKRQDGQWLVLTERGTITSGR